MQLLPLKTVAMWSVLVLVNKGLYVHIYFLIFQIDIIAFPELEKKFNTVNVDTILLSLSSCG